MPPPYGECVLLANPSPAPSTTTISIPHHRWSTISIVTSIGGVMKDGESAGNGVGTGGLKKEDQPKINADGLVEALAKLNFAAPNHPKKLNFLENGGGKKKTSALIDALYQAGESTTVVIDGGGPVEIISRSPPPKRDSGPTTVEKPDSKDKDDEENKKGDSSSASKLTNGTAAIATPPGGGAIKDLKTAGSAYKCFSEGVTPKVKQTPADFLKSSSQKSRIAARRTTNSSLEGAVPRETVTSDLRGSSGTGSTSSVHPRDNKKVEDIEKEFSALSLKGAAGVGVSVAVADGERIQRSPVSLFQQHNRHLVSPYTQQSPSSRLAAAAARQQQQRESLETGHMTQFADGQLTNQQQQLYYQQQQHQQQHAYLNSLQHQQQQFEATYQPQVTSPSGGYTLVTTPDDGYSSLTNDGQHSFDLLTTPTTAFSTFAAAGQQQQLTSPASGQQPPSTNSDQYNVTGGEIRASCAYSTLGAGENFAQTDFDNKSIDKNFKLQQKQQQQQQFRLNKKITCNNNNNNTNNRNLDQLAAELPDQLSDFILKYSRRYFESEENAKSRDELESEGRSSACSSPLEARSVPQNSPAVPANAVQHQSSLTPANSPTKSRLPHHQPAVVTDTGVSPLEGATAPPQAKQKQQGSPELPQRIRQIGQHKQKLRQVIADDDFSNAWAWAVRRSQELPGGLYFRDSDGDSSLHIVIWHKDIPKIYSLTELMNRAGGNQSFPKPFDLPNKLNETPLFLAVEKRLKEVVAYGLENSENPNISARDNESRDRGAPLHFAAERGMAEIVEVLCDCPLVDLNLLNGTGLTPLLCAVKSHRHTTEEENQQFQCLINNKPVIRALLKAGADPKLTDIETGKTVFHYAVECMDPDLLQMFRDHMDKEMVHNLVNKSCLQGYTPMDLLTRIVSSRGCNYYATEEGQTFRLKMYKTLVEIGAEMPKFACGADSPDYVYTFDPTYFT